MTRTARSPEWRYRRFGRLVMPAVLLLGSLWIVSAAQAEEAVVPAGSGGIVVAAPTPIGFDPTSVMQDDDPLGVFAGGWLLRPTSVASGGTRRVATAAGAVARFRFSGTGAALVSRVSPEGGRIEISVDSGASMVVDLAAASTVERARVWTVSGLGGGVHEVRVRALEASSTVWTADGVVVDALLVEGTPLRAAASGASIRVEEADRRLRFLGNWRQRVSATGASGGRVAVGNASGASVVFVFGGTSVSWLAPNQKVGARAQVTLDGRSYGHVGLSRSGAAGARRVMWSIGGLAPGTHTLVIRAATAPISGSRVTVDTFEVDGSVLEARPSSSLGYTWRNHIVIDKSDFRLYLVKDGRVVRTYPVATGRIGMLTPSAVWRVDAKYFTSPAGVYGPRKLRMFRRRGYPGHYYYAFTAYAMHGTNEPWVIGTLASHGCIRLYNDDVLDLFGRVPLGTMVVTRD